MPVYTASHYTICVKKKTLFFALALAALPAAHADRLTVQGGGAVAGAASIHLGAGYQWGDIDAGALRLTAEEHLPHFRQGF